MFKFIEKCIFRNNITLVLGNRKSDFGGSKEVLKSLGSISCCFMVWKTTFEAVLFDKKYALPKKSVFLLPDFVLDFLRGSFALKNICSSVVKLSNYKFSLVIILIGENPLQTSKFTNIKYDIVSQESDPWIIMAACVVNDYSLSSLSNAPPNHRIICSKQESPRLKSSLQNTVSLTK